MTFITTQPDGSLGASPAQVSAAEEYMQYRGWSTEPGFNTIWTSNRKVVAANLHDLAWIISTFDGFIETDGVTIINPNKLTELKQQLPD